MPSLDSFPEGAKMEGGKKTDMDELEQLIVARRGKRWQHQQGQVEVGVEKLFEDHVTTLEGTRWVC